MNFPININKINNSSDVPVYIIAVPSKESPNRIVSREINGDDNELPEEGLRIELVSPSSPAYLTGSNSVTVKMADKNFLQSIDAYRKPEIVLSDKELRERYKLII